MRPSRLLILLSFCITLPILLTTITLLKGRPASTEGLGAGVRTQTSRFRALFSFSTPSSFFPPSAVISLTDDNATFFLARPAAFGPSLPESGLSAELWVGRGFGEDLSEEEMKIRGFELGCSDVPGWSEDQQQWRTSIAAKAAKTREKADKMRRPYPRPHPNLARSDFNSDPVVTEADLGNDGTDDHLHYPLSDSNPAPPAKPGEPANANLDKTKPRTHADIESLQESADIAGKIVMLSRGGCGFLEKVKWAQRRGGVALIVGDNQPSFPLTIMYAKGDTSNVTIPALFTSYNAAHLLSTLMPADKDIDMDGKIRNNHPNKSFDKKSQKGTPKASAAATEQRSKSLPRRQSTEADKRGSWMQDVLSAVGLTDPNVEDEDSHGPPNSGNINWVLLEDWEAGKTSAANPVTLKTSTSSGKSRKTQPTSTSPAEADFIIGVHDWRDPDMMEPKRTASRNPEKRNGQPELARRASAVADDTKTETGKTSADKSHLNTEAEEHIAPAGRLHGASQHDHGLQETGRQSIGSRILSFFHNEEDHPETGRKENQVQYQPEYPIPSSPVKQPDHDHKEHRGLWVTLTPTSVSTSPFFDTLLVLVVSPLVTLTVVYGLLLLRSRIRRRRWRAPKSVVERLPTRIYHTMSTTSSTTSSQRNSPSESTNTSPQLRPSSARSRSRSETAADIATPAPEKTTKSKPKPKKYTGRQIECVVCLEEYVDGESLVMSLPCGHEFHADCITPWLVTRRRTCPICKGDVVRTLSGPSSNRNGSVIGEDMRQEGEETSDDIQVRAAETTNDEASAAIPIPLREGELMDEDVERGADVRTPLLGSSQTQPSGWRGLLRPGISQLSGDTLWRSTPNDRSR